MNLRHLKTLVAIAEHPTLSATGEAIGLSHSAVSLHVKALEDELGVALVDRRQRPVVLTERGQALLERARQLVELVEDIRRLGSEQRLIGRLTVGVVPTALIELLPPALAALNAEHPELRVRIRTGLSGELAQQVRHGELDAAIVTAPEWVPEGLAVREIGREPLVVIAPAGAAGEDDTALLAGHSFIWFSRKTWAGQQIEGHLNRRGLQVREVMEIDSLEAIESLVRHGLGVSVVPQRPGTDLEAKGLRTVPFGRPQAWRVLTLLERIHNSKERLVDGLYDQLVEALSNAQGKT
ncbi:MAG: LysR substrate-binding domain-containing protein [Candidatus Competibacterales bacterium]